MNEITHPRPTRPPTWHLAPLLNLVTCCQCHLEHPCLCLSYLWKIKHDFIITSNEKRGITAEWMYPTYLHPVVSSIFMGINFHRFVINSSIDYPVLWKVVYILSFTYKIFIACARQKENWYSTKEYYRNWWDNSISLKVILCMLQLVITVSYLQGIV